MTARALLSVLFPPSISCCSCRCSPPLLSSFLLLLVRRPEREFAFSRSSLLSLLSLCVPVPFFSIPFLSFVCVCIVFLVSSLTFASMCSCLSLPLSSSLLSSFVFFLLVCWFYIATSSPPPPAIASGTLSPLFLLLSRLCPT